jgi:epoxyqueuosine reductase
MNNSRCKPHCSITRCLDHQFRGIIFIMNNLTTVVRETAHELGFDHCRIIPVEEAPHADFFTAWLTAGRTGEMHYLARYVEKRRNPARLAEAGRPEFRSLIVLAVNHHQFDLPAAIRADPSRGLIASYAWGDDYHELIRPLLYEVDTAIRRYSGRTSPGKCLVDTGPVLERDWAQRAGVGFTGKNCCTIHPVDGSWLLLATILVPEVLAYDPPSTPLQSPEVSVIELMSGLPADAPYGAWRFPLEGTGSTSENPKSKIGTCGRCTRCLDACPTDAFVGPFHLDPLRCISYWTIEAKAPIPRALRSLFGNRIFGCDICQEVCPWNQRLPERTPRIAGLVAQSGRVAPPLLEGFAAEHPYWLDLAAFRTRFARSPILRAKRHGMLRNVCVALGNWADPMTLPALRLALNDGDSLVRGHAAWALGQVLRRHRLPDARAALESALSRETEESVREELTIALNGGSAD